MTFLMNVRICLYVFSFHFDHLSDFLILVTLYRIVNLNLKLYIGGVNWQLSACDLLGEVFPCS